MPRSKFVHTYEDIISIENLLAAWKLFIRGKKNRKDTQGFQLRLVDNILDLHLELKEKTYLHRGYQAFSISDPKPRNIHKASVRDRILHRAIYEKLYPYFDKKFISDSFSCRQGKGTHEALRRFKKFTSQVSKNNTKTVWVLKCDIKKFFASIDQKILMNILSKYISDEDILGLISKIVGSFYSTKEGVGLPLGNLTSQLLVNIYMNEFDQFMKNELRVKYYIRYADDFVVLSEDRTTLEHILGQISRFLEDRLRLSLHPNKIFIKTVASGADYLGWIHFPDRKILRTATKNRMMKNLEIKIDYPATIESYRGLLMHGNTYKLKKRLGL